MRERITSKELAKLIGVSSATISRAFSTNGRISDQTHVRVLACLNSPTLGMLYKTATLNALRNVPPSEKATIA